jgi:hypothetical protein
MGAKFVETDRFLDYWPRRWLEAIVIAGGLTFDLGHSAWTITERS